MRKVITAGIVVAGASVALFTGCSSLTKEPEVTALPPAAAPAGYKWVINSDYSDEFNGTKLNTDKWHDTYPGWVGRAPGKFVPSTISVSDGFMKIKCGVLDPALSEGGKWTVACGAVQSKANQALYGYYETRMKASGLTTSSTFWLKNGHDDDEDLLVRTELDIQECIGDARRWPNFKKRMMSNTHQQHNAKTPGEKPKEAKKGGNFTLESGTVSDAFHTYGCWWVDANTMKFYLDGKYVYTITPPTDLDETPFDLPMFVNMVCETYNWEQVPTKEELNNDKINTTYYDYVRSYKLVKE